jgi:hypothetical protein
MNDIKETSDLGLIAGLMTKGYQPLERRKDGKRVLFVFESDQNFEALCEDYYNNRMEVDANSYQRMLKSVKMSIYQMEEKV